jgi:hypothetical protein
VSRRGRLPDPARLFQHVGNIRQPARRNAWYIFANTEKKSARRARAYIEELAPWHLAKVRRYLDRIGYHDPVPAQKVRAQLSGSREYGRRECRNLCNSAISSLSQARKRLMARGSELTI